MLQCLLIGFNPATFFVLSHSMIWSEGRLFVLITLVGIVDHHCLNVLFLHIKMLMQSIIFYTGKFITCGEAFVTVATSLYMDVGIISDCYILVILSTIIA